MTPIPLPTEDLNCTPKVGHKTFGVQFIANTTFDILVYLLKLTENENSFLFSIKNRIFVIESRRTKRL